MPPCSRSSLLLILLLSRGHPARFGLRRPASLGRGVFLLPAALSVAVSGVSRLFRLSGLPFVEQYSLWQQILFIWVFASVAEETLTRGLIQGFLAPLSNRGINLAGRRLSVPVLTGALFFAAMHLLLFTMGIPAATVLLIVFFAFLLGIVAGHYRETTGSLAPAVLAHATANAAGALADWLLGTL
jgi:membrane protease YdiL (CAAX protease family)